MEAPVVLLQLLLVVPQPKKRNLLRRKKKRKSRMRIWALVSLTRLAVVGLEGSI